MSHRGYGDPPYPSNEPNPQGRAATGRERGRRGGSEVEPDSGRFEPWDDDPRSPGYVPDDRARGGGSRWSIADDDRNDVGSGRQSRSRWSNPPPRRRRNASSGGRSAVDPGPPFERIDARPAGAGVYNDRLADPSYGQDWSDTAPSERWPDEIEPVPRTRRQPRLSGRARATRGQLTGAAPGRRARPALPPIRLPVSLTRVDILQDHVAVLLLSVATLSALVMAGVLAGRTGELPEVIELRYDAVGAPTRWGTPTSLWQLPLLAGMVTLINLILAWWLSSYDRFAGRFLLATASVVSLLTWIPLVRFLW